MTVPFWAAKKKKLLRITAHTGTDNRIFFHGITTFFCFFSKKWLEIYLKKNKNGKYIICTFVCWAFVLKESRYCFSSALIRGCVAG